MSEKVKVYNDRSYDIGVKLLNNQDVNIRAGSFIMMTEDDIAYVESQCVFNKKLFGTGKLRIDEKKKEVAENAGVMKSDENFHLPKDEIEKILLGNFNAMKKWLGTIEDKPLLFEIYETAKAIDLSASKMKAIKATLPEVMTADEE